MKSLLFLCLLTLTSAFAESATEQLPAVVVTATGWETDVFNVPFTLEWLTAERLGEEQLVRTLPEALRETPGVMVQKTAHGQGSPFIRGFTGFRTVLLIDGIRLNNSTFREGPNQYWTTVDPASIDRLEVVKGPGSVLYGSDAIGGTVQVLTKRYTELSPARDWDGAVSYRFASAEDSHTGRAEVGANAKEHLGIFVGATAKNYGDLRAGEPTGTQRKTGYDEWDGDAKAEYHFDDDRKLVLAFQHVSQNDAWRTHRTIFGEGFHGTTVGTDRVHTFDQARDLGYLQYHAQHQHGPIDSIKASASYQLQDEELTRVRSNGVREESDVKVQTGGWWVQLASPSPVGTLTYGAEYYRDWVGSGQISIATNGTVTRAIQGPVADDASYDAIAAYLQDEIPLGSRVDAIVGGRYTYSRADANRVRDPVAGGLTSLQDDWHSGVGSGRLLWRVDEDDHWRWFAGASQGFRAPNLSDLTRLDIARSGEIETAAPGLDPETFVALETGVKHQTDTVAAELAYFYTFIEDMIVRQPTGAIVNGANEVTKRNGGDGFVHGVEANARWQFHPQLAAFGWVTWMEGEVDGYPTSAPTRREEYLSRVMPLSGELGLRWDAPSRKWWSEFVTLLVDQQDKLSSGDKADTQRIPPGGTPGYGVLTLRGGWRINENFTLSAALENIADKDYRVHGSGLNAPGRNIILAGTTRF